MEVQPHQCEKIHQDIEEVAPEVDKCLVETNPTADNVESDDQQVVVCYDFSNRVKQPPVVQVEQPVEAADERQQAQDTETPKQSLQHDQQVRAVVLQQQQFDESVQTAEVAIKNRRESLEIITTAFNQRKESNLTNFNSYVSKREEYHSDLSKCLVKIEEGTHKRMGQTECFAKQIIKSLKEMRQVYKTFSKDLAKVSFAESGSKNNSLWGTVLPQGLRFINNYKNTCAQSSKVFSQWIDTECLPKIQQSFLAFRQKVESQLREVRKLRESTASSPKQFTISTNTRVKDQLTEQFKMSRLMQEERNKIQEWGAAASRLLETVSSKDAETVGMLKFEVASLVGHLKLISRQSHHLFQAENYWISVPSDQETAFNRVLSEIGVEGLVNGACKPEGKLKMQDLHKYLILEGQQDGTGSIRQILRQLHVSNYKVMSDFDKNNKWRPSQAYFSVDNHLILLDQLSNVKNCMNLKEIEYQVANFDLKIKERQRGVFTTWNREKLRFNSSNQVEEFVMLIDSMKDLHLDQ